MPREMATVGLDTALDVDLGSTLVPHRRNALVGLQATVVNGVLPAAVLVMVDASRRASQQYNAIFVMEQLEVAGAQFSVFCPTRVLHVAGISMQESVRINVSSSSTRCACFGAVIIVPLLLVHV
eukprot:COSAG01_NODE_4012_length_5435_cov_2.306409_5_plen_124_part_00